MDFMNIQQFSIVIGYVSQDLMLAGTKTSPYTKFGVISKVSDGKTALILCAVRGDIARQFVEQHTKGSIVVLYGELIPRYDPFHQNKTTNQLNVMGWMYLGDIQATFPGISDEELAYLTNRLKAFRTSTPAQRAKIMEKISIPEIKDEKE